MSHMVRATGVLAVFWSMLAIGESVDSSFFVWTGRLVLAIVGAPA